MNNKEHNRQLDQQRKHAAYNRRRAALIYDCESNPDRLLTISVTPRITDATEAHGPGWSMRKVITPVSMRGTVRDLLAAGHWITDIHYTSVTQADCNISGGDPSRLEEITGTPELSETVEWKASTPR